MAQNEMQDAALRGATARRARPSDWYAVGFLVFATLMIALYAVSLNHLFYAVYGPFYDSMAYANQLAIVMAEGKQSVRSGIASALPLATVVLPWIEGAILGKFTVPSRDLAVWLQAPWLLVQVVVAFFYFRDFIRYPAYLAAAFALVLGSFAAIFFFNGGLSDLRMDLWQALTFGAAVAAYFVARARGTWLSWIMFGALIAISCLARATSPVYFVLIFGVIAIGDLLPPDTRRFYLIRYAAAAAVAAFGALWFFIINFERLHYYYFVWNADATARLPLSQSITHADMVLNQHIGQPLLIVLGLSLVASLAMQIWRRPVFAGFNWRALWAGVAPVGFLVVSGAGLNPFVSLVSVPGILLFALAPFRTRGEDSPRPLGLALASAALIGCLLTAAQGVPNHTTDVSSWLPLRAPIDQLATRMLADIGDAGARSFDITYVGSLPTDALVNTLVYEHGFQLDPRFCARRGEVTLTRLQPPGQPAEWAQLPGQTDTDKVTRLSEEVLRSADYIIAPEDNSQLQQELPINRYAFTLRRMMTDTGQLVALGDPIAVSKTETVTLYRNRSRGAGSTPGPACS